MKFIKGFLFVIVSLSSFLSWSFQLDWSGYFKSQVIYFQPWKKTSADDYVLLSGNYLVLDAKARASDGVLITSKFSVFGKDQFDKEVSDERHNKKRGVIAGSSQTTLLEATHFYATYTGEHYKVDIGRQPLDFGLGMTYSDGASYIKTVYNFRDAVSFTARSGSLFIKPWAILKSSSIDGALEGGFEKDDLGLKAFYVRSVEDLDTFNVYGFYKRDSLKFSAEWASMIKNNKFQSMAGAMEVDWKAPFSSNVILAMGYVMGDKTETGDMSEAYILNKNYGHTAIFWEYFPKEEDTDGLSDCIFASLYGDTPVSKHFTVGFVDSLMKKSSPLRPLNLVGNEMLLFTVYDSKKGFMWETLGGYLWMFDDPDHWVAFTRVSVKF